MATKPDRSHRQAGQDWLLACSRNPTDVCRAWAAEELARIPSGEHWQVAEGLLLPSIRAMKHMGSLRLGPVLVDVAVALAWWLVPADVGDGLSDVRQLVRQVLVHPADWLLACPPVLHPIGERGWLERPDGSGRLTNPTALSAALGLHPPQPSA